MNMFGKEIFSLVIISLFCLYGCDNDLPGIYVANYKYGADTLRLFSNGTFQQHYAAANDVSFFDTGRWTDDNGILHFYNFVQYNHDSGASAVSKPYWIAFYDRSFFGN